MLRRVLHDTHAVAMVEFAIILPMMLLTLLGAVEMPRAMIAANRATYLADNMAQMVSQVRLPIDTPTMRRFSESAPLINSSVLDYARQTNRSDIWNTTDVNITSVLITPPTAAPGCTSNCFTANVVFSVAYTGSSRACGTLAAGNNNYSATTIPAGLFQPGALIVVDVVTSYKPLFTMFFNNTVRFRRSAYFRPRYVPRVDFVDPGNNHNCAGYNT